MTTEHRQHDLDGPWTDRVEYYDHAGSGVAFRPSCVYYAHASVDEVESYHSSDAMITPLDALGSQDVGDGTQHRPGPPMEWCVHDPGLDVVRHCRELGRRNVQCEPNFVFFADAITARPHPADISGNPLFGNPLFGNPLFGNPLFGNPLFGNPLFGNGPFASETYARPVWGTPVYRSPVYSDRFHAPAYRDTGRRPTSARPTAGRNALSLETDPCESINVIVIDTGMAHGAWQPKLLAGYSGDRDKPDYNDDHILDPVAGHGTFIAGILATLVPGIPITSRKVLSSFGDGDVCDLRKIVHELHLDSNTIVNMSFSSYGFDDMIHLSRIVEYIQSKGAVVVSSAGNDATGRPTFPASIPDVVGVGGLGLNGPADFTNHGPWLRACAPSLDLTSTFFVDEGAWLDDPQAPLPGSPDEPTSFGGWARWTGTSFASPIVAAAIAREMLRTGHDAATATRAIIDGPDLMRIPNLGTVVNLCPPLPSRSQPEPS